MDKNNSKLVKGALAGVAVVALAAGGSTFSAWSDFGSINDNQVGAGILKLNLNDGDGSGVTALDFGDLAPGVQGQQAIFVASSDGRSVPKADLYMTIQNLRDYENGCGTNASEQAADPTCTASSAGDGTLGGELSRALDMRITSYAAPDALTCKGWVGGTGDPGPALNSAVISNEIGNLADPANRNHQFKINGDALSAGDGVCVVFTSWWPHDRSGTVYDPATAPVDNAAQSDSLKFDAKFDLVQS